MTAEQLTAIATAEPTEPVFILRGSDPSAYLLTLMWGCLQVKLGAISNDQMAVACVVASAMEDWARAQGQDVDEALRIWTKLLLEAGQRFQAVMAEKASGCSVH